MAPTKTKVFPPVFPPGIGWEEYEVVDHTLYWYRERRWLPWTCEWSILVVLRKKSNGQLYWTTGHQGDPAHPAFDEPPGNDVQPLIWQVMDRTLRDARWSTKEIRRRCKEFRERVEKVWLEAIT